MVEWDGKESAPLNFFLALDVFTCGARYFKLALVHSLTVLK